MSRAIAEPILVTGASGIVGSNLVHELVKSGYRPHALMRETSSRMRLAPVADRVGIVTSDLLEAEHLREAVGALAPRTVFHLATSIFNPPRLTSAEHLEINTLGALNLLEALRDMRGCRVVITNSAAIYGGGRRIPETAPLQPSTVYGATKAAAGLLAQTYARLYWLSLVELRLFTTYGPWERPARLVPDAILSALGGRDLQISGGTQERDFVYSEDASEALMLAGSADVASGSVFNISSGHGMKIADMARTILDLMGNPVELKIGARQMRPDEIMEISGDNSAAASGLGWRPRHDLRAGLEKTIAWYRSNRELALQLS